MTPETEPTSAHHTHATAVGRARSGGVTTPAAPGEAQAAGAHHSQRHRPGHERVTADPRAAPRPGWAFDTTVADARRQARAAAQPEVAGDLAASLRRLTGLLHGHVDADAMLAEVTALAATVTRCCQELERRLAADPAGYPPPAARRMTQASGAAEALTTRLTDVIAAIRDRTT